MTQLAKPTPKGGENESQESSLQQHRNLAGDGRRERGASEGDLQVEQLLRDAGALVVPRALEQEVCDALIRGMRAGVSRPTEPLNLKTGKREPSEHARQSMHDVAFIWEYTLRKLLETDEQLLEFLEQPFEVDRSAFLFLSYELGGFIAPHRDGVGNDNELAAFGFILNDAFEGGEFVICTEEQELVFGMPPGTLIVFRSDVLHSVREVTGGTRFSAVGSLNRSSF
jgi:2OG-Fe(II) oxygenase superfamily